MLFHFTFQYAFGAVIRHHHLLNADGVEWNIIHQAEKLVASYDDVPLQFWDVSHVDVAHINSFRHTEPQQRRHDHSHSQPKKKSNEIIILKILKRIEEFCLWQSSGCAIDNFIKEIFWP